MHLLTEQTAVVARTAPKSQSAGTVLTEAIALGTAHGYTFTVIVGAVGAGGTVDFQIKGATSSGGTYTAISGTAITQMATANKISRVEISSIAIEQLGLGYTHIKGEIVVGTAACEVCVVAEANKLRLGVGADNDSADVVEIVTKVT